MCRPFTGQSCKLSMYGITMEFAMCHLMWCTPCVMD